MSNNIQSSRRKFIKQAALGMAGGFALPLHSKGQIRKDEWGFAAKPVLANVAANGIEVIVAPKGFSTGWIEYGETEQLGRKVEGTMDGRFPFSDRVLHFSLNGLAPGKKYYYQVHLQRVVFETNWSMKRTEVITSDLNSFVTFNPDGNSASFTCWNDTHENDETIERLTQLLDKQQSDFLLWNGDVTNDIFREEQIVEEFLNPGGQAYATSTPVMYARGNHDVRGQDAPYLRDYVTGPNDKYYFGLRNGPVACLVMDTGEDKPDQHEEYGGLANFSSYRSMQAEWLENIIEEPWFQNAPYRIVFMHIPLVWDQPSKYREWDGECIGWICEDAYNKWHSYLSKGNVQLVISGHTHRHRYIPPDEDRIYGQLIGGGPNPERATCITGRADQNNMTITMTDLDQTLLEELKFNPIN